MPLFITKIVFLCIFSLTFIANVMFLTLVAYADNHTESTNLADEDAVMSMPVEQAGTDFVPLVGIPFVDTTGQPSLGDYINGLYLAAISIAAFLAVVKIIFAGVQYMLSEVVTNKEQAKKSIYGAIIGLLIVLGAFLILNTINPNLTNLTNLDGPQLQTQGGNTNIEVVDGDFIDTCDEVGGGSEDCGRVSCETFDSQVTSNDFWGWAAWGSGYNALTTVSDRFLNEVTCDYQCGLIGGQTTNELTESGDCIFPSNQQDAKRNVLQTETEALKNKYSSLESLPANTIAVECFQSQRTGATSCDNGEDICSDINGTDIQTAAGGSVVTCVLP